MPSKRDIEAFEARGDSYDEGWLGQMHHDIADRTLALIVAVQPRPERVLDIGCGSGYLLKALSERLDEARSLWGVDPARSMIRSAHRSPSDPRLQLLVGTAEGLPYRSDSFDLVVSTTSFDHWSNQEAGLRECARVLRPRAQLVLVDLFSLWLVPTAVSTRSDKARTRGRMRQLLSETGFDPGVWHRVYGGIIQAVMSSNS